MKFLADRFEAPALLWHLLLVAALATLAVVSLRKRRRLLEPWPRILAASERMRQGAPRMIAVRFIGLTCLVIAMAGPRWSGTEPVKKAPGRDVMIVLDLSRSMNAEQPSRLDKAVRSLRTLADSKQVPPGTRLGLVVFAAKPWLAFPLTNDVHHLASTLDQISAGDQPTEVRGDKDGVVSGTRIGAALQLALDGLVGRVSAPSSGEGAAVAPGRVGDPSHKMRPKGEIVLLSDGDDPEDDDEWRHGLTAARTHGVPVHVVAVGEPGVKSTIPYRGDVLRFGDDVVTTEVQRQRLDDIARGTDGLSLTLDRGELPLAGLLAQHWAKTPPSGDLIEVTTRIVPVRRLPWLVAALIALLADGGFAWPRWGRLAPTAVAVSCLLLVSAMPASIGDEALRRGQEAYREQRFADAVAWFDKAQPALADPGLAAFNRAAAHFRLGDFAAAADDYRRTLDDAAIDAGRRDRAWFDLGNALLFQSADKDRGLLVSSIESYKKCLAGQPDATLKRDAEYNLEIAERRLGKLQPPPPKARTEPNPPNPTDDPKKEDPSSNPQNPSTPQKAPSQGGASGASVVDDKASSKTGAPSKITVLLDQTNPIAMTPEQAAATLSFQRDRIAHDRRNDRRTYDTVPSRGKDW